jgi:hypothetical protein
VLADGASWLARRAAWDVDDELAATLAATFTADALREVVPHVQQVCGAIGLTDELGLTRVTGKMLVLSTELGGATAHARDHARARFLTGRARRPAPGYRGRGVRP